MKYIEVLSQVLYVCTGFYGGYLLYVGVPETTTRLTLVVVIMVSLLTWSLPLYLERWALLELSRRGYSVNIKREGPTRDWSANKPGYGTSGHRSVYDLLKAVRDHDYRKEIIDEHERHKAGGLTY